MKNKKTTIYTIVGILIFIFIILLIIKLNSWERKFEVTDLEYTSDKEENRLGYHELNILNKTNKTLNNYYAIFEVKLMGGNAKNKKIKICEKVGTLSPNESVNVKITDKKIDDYIKYNKYTVSMTIVKLVNIKNSCVNDYEKVLNENNRSAKKIVEQINKKMENNKTIKTTLDDLEDYTTYYKENKYAIISGKITNVDFEYSDILNEFQQIVYLSPNTSSNKTIKITTREINEKAKVDIGKSISIKADCYDYITTSTSISSSCYSGSIATEEDENDEFIMKYTVEEYLDYIEKFKNIFFEFYGYSWLEKEYIESNFIYSGKVRKRFGEGYKYRINYKANYEMNENYYFGRNICKLLENNRVWLYDCTKVET